MNSENLRQLQPKTSEYALLYQENHIMDMPRGLIHSGNLNKDIKDAVKSIQTLREEWKKTKVYFEAKEEIKQGTGKTRFGKK
jgi:hypothetical protein